MESLLEYQTALKIASAILIKKGEVSLGEIEAFPFIDRDFDPQIIANALKQMYDVEVISRKISSFPYMQWDNIIRLNAIPENCAQYSK